MTPLHTIHQFHVGAVYGDGVTNAMLLTRRLLRAIGLRSEIYAVIISPELQGDILPHTAYRHAPEQLLIVHHSMGHELRGWIEGVPTPKLLVYHNITPPSFFSTTDPLRAQVVLGRDQLTAWARDKIFRGAVGVSTFNAEELLQVGHTPVATIPLLVDLDVLRAAALLQRPLRDSTAELLFVGRLTPHKCQIDLLEVCAALRPLLDRPVRLTLVGGGDPTYLAQLQARIAELDLRDAVHLPGRLTNLELHEEYRKADLFLSLSEPECFGMPLLEAAVFGVPVLA